MKHAPNIGRGTVKRSGSRSLQGDKLLGHFWSSKLPRAHKQIKKEPEADMLYEWDGEFGFLHDPSEGYPQVR